MVIKAVFLDFDGTISDARKIAEDSLVLTLNEFGFEYDKKKAFGLLGIKMRLVLKELKIGSHKLEKIRKRFYEHFKQISPLSLLIDKILSLRLKNASYKLDKYYETTN